MTLRHGPICLKSAPPVASSHAGAIGGSSALHSYGGVLAP